MEILLFYEVMVFESGIGLFDKGVSLCQEKRDYFAFFSQVLPHLST